MNEAERRRQKLLMRTRELYRDSYDSPAVHPRYGAAYRLLYEEPQEFKSGTLGLRLFISFLLFAAFVAMDYKKDEFMSVNSSEIIQMISEDTSAYPILEHR